MRKILLLLAIAYCSLGAQSTIEPKIQVHLRSPKYEDGVLSTSQGGVIEGKGIRIQAKHLIFFKSKEGSYVKARGELWVTYQGKHFVGERLEYYFATQSGWIEKGRTQLGNWYLGGEKVVLKPQGAYELEGMTSSTCEGEKNLWQLKVAQGDIEDHDLIRARNIQLQLFHLPVFWMPYFRARLTTLENILARYEFITGGSVGDRLSVRYQLFSIKNLKTYLQGDYWFTRGPSASLQFDYQNQKQPSSFKANNFIAFDYHGAHPYGTFRNRFVGELSAQLTPSMSIYGEYDKLSDDNVLETYFNRDYFLHIERRTQVQLRAQRPRWLGFLRTEMRINPFDIVSQELPYFNFSRHPFTLFNQRLITDFSFNAGYFDYVFGNILNNSPENFRSPRIELHPKIYAPLRLGPFNILGFGEYLGIGYGQSPLGKALWSSLGHGGGELNLSLTKVYSSKVKHVIQPYSSYDYYSRPTVSFQDHYLFNFYDSYVKLNQLKWGLKNIVYFKPSEELLVPLLLDVYSFGFFNNQTIGSFIPKMYAEFSTRLDRLYFQMIGGYNLQHNLIDFGNFRFAFTLNEKFAFSCQFMHRSRYAFKKANFENFFLDVFRPQAQLLNSPLSDQRDVFLTSLYFRPHPRVIFEFKSRSGWNRERAPYYNEVFFTTILMLPCNFLLYFTPRKTVPEGWRFEFKFEIGPKPPDKPDKNFIFW